MNSHEQLTDRQQRILDLYRRRADSGQPPPTYRELCREFGWRSTGTASDHLKVLVRKGALAPGMRTARGAHLRREQNSTVVLPLVGRIVAGRPVISDEIAGEHLAIPSFLAPSSDGFLLQVTGDSMKDAGILEGDHVIVQRQETANDGEIVVAMVEGETTLKRLRKQGDGMTLEAENPRYRPIELREESASIQGVVVGLFRSYGGRRPRKNRGLPPSRLHRE